MTTITNVDIIWIFNICIIKIIWTQTSNAYSLDNFVDLQKLVLNITTLLPIGYILSSSELKKHTNFLLYFKDNSLRS